MLPPDHARSRAWIALFGAVMFAAIASLALRSPPPSASDSIAKMPANTPATALSAGTATSSDSSPPDDPDSTPALSPSDSLATLTIADGFEVELVAAEPLVEAPVAATFDEDGRLWVVEMRTYMPDVAGTGEQKPTNRIVVLTDDDRDGSMDRAVTFLDDLVLPRGVAPCHGGALVLAPPDLLFCKDTDGDGRADERRVLLSGFGGRENPEHAGNGLVYGIDNWYHLSQHGLEFRFDGERVETRPTPVVGQWGITRDDHGRLYYTPNSNPLLADAYPKHYAARNPAIRGAPGIGERIMADSAVWPAHSTPGVNRAYQPGTLRDDRRLASLTGACGPLVLRSPRPGWLGQDVFICEPAGNLVKALRLTPPGESTGHAVAENAFQRREFLTSTDPRFRPVNLTTGPDGFLYIVDMYRGLIQHKTYLSEYLKKHTRDRGLETPINMGRIHRVRPAAAAASDAGSMPLSRASNAELVAKLAADLGWERDTAQRLLVERRATDVAAQLRTLVRDRAAESIPRLHAIWTLEGLRELTPADVALVLGDRDAVLREHAIRLSEAYPGDSDLRVSVIARLDDPAASVRTQVVLSLAASSDFTKTAVEVLRRWPDDRMLRGAVFSGLRAKERAVLIDLVAEAAWPESSADRAALNELVDLALRAESAERTELIEWIAQLVAGGDARGEAMLARVVAAQRLNNEDPIAMGLASEPRVWLATARSTAPNADLLARAAVYFDWPGRPPVERRRRTAQLTKDDESRLARGRELFNACAACHQPDGRGAPGLAPSLVGSPIVLGSEDQLARILILGLEGEYELGGQKFAGAMPAVEFPDHSEYAAVLTYIRRAWGHAADPVRPETIERVRATIGDRKTSLKREELNAPR